MLTLVGSSFWTRCAQKTGTLAETGWTQETPPRSGETGTMSNINKTVTWVITIDKWIYLLNGLLISWPFDYQALPKI